MFKCRSLQIAVIVSAMFVAASAFRAEAAVYPGTLSTFSSGAGNDRSLFTLSNNNQTLSITGSPTNFNKWYVNTGTGNGAQQIVGIRSVYLVNANGTAPTGITTSSGYIAPNSTSASKTAWTVLTSGTGSFSVLDDNDGGNGFSNNGKWLELSTPSLAGKSDSLVQPFGSFTFSGPLLNPNGTPKYDLGLDVLFAGATGSTQRVYFAMSSIQPVPEAGTLVLFGLLIGSMCVYVRRKKATAKVEA